MRHAPGRRGYFVYGAVVGCPDATERVPPVRRGVAGGRGVANGRAGARPSHLDYNLVDSRLLYLGKDRLWRSPVFRAS